MHEKSDYDCILDLHFSEENPDDDTPSTPPEPLPDPAAPKVFGGPKQILEQ